ncbi:flagellar hook-basal body complex protein FliE [Chelatococcus sp. SYSU_G07232]|uniref:Flagellar hook-basal body complex protein FliE n=1 Tax=Chelatococcus albus TaxID=3047466 RepID=A0ABT7AH77_9HYPH|nr:flagellar hook-basal body complex protein FliE [Chelatococcus sp. SYSU_G07232]MDJ1158440.1 flagellar hook-basal body complex protein FliE [Chelatococcus sp. SYSU_G07232]
MATPTFAAGAYTSVQRLATQDSLKPAFSGETSSADGSFAALVSQAIDGVAQAGQKAESQGIAAVQGKGDIVDVVTAVAESEAAVESLVAVRDRVIAAYEEIMRMPI